MHNIIYLLYIKAIFHSLELYKCYKSNYESESLHINKTSNVEVRTFINQHVSPVNQVWKLSPCSKTVNGLLLLLLSLNQPHTNMN